MRSKLMLFVGILTVITAGCAQNRVNLVENGTVLLGKAPSEQARIASAYVYQDEHELVIYGKVSRDDGSSVIQQGHVDITIISPNGTIIKQASIADHLTNIRMRYAKESTFSARFPIVPAPGTKIRLAWHRRDSSHEDAIDSHQHPVNPE